MRTEPNYQADDGAIFVRAWAMANVLTDYLERHTRGAAKGETGP
jgi:hypothetical protein